MEGIHGVDVSWLHQPSPNKEFHHHHRTHAPTSPGGAKDAPPRTSSKGGLPASAPDSHPATPPSNTTPNTRDPSPPLTTGSAHGQSTKTPPQKRPITLGRSVSEKAAGLAPPDQGKPRRNSWITNLSAKFSSSPTSASQSLAGNAPVAKPATNGVATVHAQAIPPSQAKPATTNGAHTQQEAAEILEPYVPQQPKSTSSSFFSSALRRLSSGSQGAVGAKVVAHGGVCPRRVMNVDPNRERCLVPELENAKLRRVAFCVDVEIAGGPRYNDEEDASEKKKKFKEKKLKEKGEGEALKHPQLAATAENGVDTQAASPAAPAITTTPAPTTASTSSPPASAPAPPVDASASSSKPESAKVSEMPNPEGSTAAPAEEKKDGSKKKEKKKRSEAERKERKEKKRRKAEENGQIPLELSRDSEESSAVPTPSGTSTPRIQDRPTTDPLRVYRRCCQLRETPILKRISDQLAHPHNCPNTEPGTVTTLDLTGSRLQLADVVTLSDWLAVVPVKKLLLEDADLSDEGVRVILAGLLAAKTPQVTRRRFHSPMRNPDNKYQAPRYEERSGVIEKLVLKNNPKLTKIAWKHLSLFIYMCKSLRAIDVSMNAFPKSLQKLQSNGSANSTSTNGEKQTHLDAADVFSKSLSERLAGARLEELIMAECSLSMYDIRKIIDAVTVSGLKRLGLASNNLDDEGLDYVIRYLKSGICEGLDLGGNNLRGRLGKLSQGFIAPSNLWALSLAGCNLTPECLKPLFPALIPLEHLKFLDLSHNRELFSTDPSAIGILRKYLPQLNGLKRIHFTDVSMSPAQAIALAEILPEIPHIAHVNILENPKLSALAHSSDEASQEEACALYASLMAAVRVSDTIIAIEIDVPGPETGEVVKALAKQVIAYCLRNMDKWTSEATGDDVGQGLVTEKEVQVPDVLIHLVGHVEGFNENHDDDDPAPDDDYIVGGTGVVKALSYVLLERAADLRRGSLSPSGATTPKTRIEDAESAAETTAKAKEMSKNLLGSARKIRMRLQLAMTREATSGDESAYRRLIFLDQTLQSIIKRFEDEYPETRVDESSTQADAVLSDSASDHSAHSLLTDPTNTSASVMTDITHPDGDSDSDTPDGPPDQHKYHHHRSTSEVSIASRALSIEEGRIHRLGQHVRQNMLRASSPATSDSSRSHSPAPVSSVPVSNPSSTTARETPADVKNRIDRLSAKFAEFRDASGPEILGILNRDGWHEVCRRIGQNAEELRLLETEHPEEFEAFRRAQLAALANRGERIAGLGRRESDEADEVAVQD